jgi:putative ABC transport system ATP-binding protein
MLELKSLTKTYHNGKENVCAVKGVSLEINGQDYLAIAGPSGSGKSTLLHMLGGLEVPTTGEVVFEGKNIYGFRDDELSAWRNRMVGFVFQFYHLIEELDVRENIAIASFNQKRDCASKKALELLKYLEIEDRKNFFPSQLSGGEKQRVAIARALINEPQIVLCDEPTGSLDKDSQDKVIGLLEKLNREMKKTVIIVTHNMELAKRADRILSIRGGEVKFD